MCVAWACDGTALLWAHKTKGDQVSDEAFIRIESLHKLFGRHVALDGVDFSMRRGEFFSLLGPSGCGKTTLLRIIAGFEYPDRGEIYLEGMRITDMPPNKRPSNMVFQSYAIFPHLNVAQNIAYGLRRSGLNKAEIAARVDAALAMIQLPDSGARRADQLSGGQRQRVALARALVKRPKVLLLDEPLGALDKRLREAMQIELRQIQRQVGITFIFVTHDQEEALSMSDRVAVMSEGKVLQIATPCDLYEKPNCREVAEFIGTMNFFEGGLFGRISDQMVAVRPDKIHVTKGDDGMLQGVVSASAYMGERSYLRIRVHGLAEPVAVAAQQSFEIGEQVCLSWDKNDELLLPRD